MNGAKLRALLKQNNLPDVEEELLDARWFASKDEWWVRTPSGWYWFDRRSNQWQRAPLGPP